MEKIKRGIVLNQFEEGGDQGAGDQTPPNGDQGAGDQGAGDQGEPKTLNLEDLIGKDKLEEIKGKLPDGQSLELIGTNTGNWIPKDKFNALNAEAKATKETVETLKQQIEELGANNPSQELKDQIATLNNTIAEKEKALNQTVKVNAIKLEALKNGLRSDVAPEDLVALIGKDKIEAIEVKEDGKVEVADLFTELKTNKAYLFEAGPTGTGGQAGAGPKPGAKTAKDLFIEGLKKG